MSPAKVNQLMKKLGFEAVRSGNKRGYLVVELTLDQVNQNRSAWGIICGKRKPDIPQEDQDRALRNFCQ